MPFCWIKAPRPHDWEQGLASETHWRISRFSRKAPEAESTFGSLSKRTDVLDLGSSWVNERESFKRKFHVRRPGNTNTKYEIFCICIYMYTYLTDICKKHLWIVRSWSAMRYSSLYAYFHFSSFSSFPLFLFQPHMHCIFSLRNIFTLLFSYC